MILYYRQILLEYFEKLGVEDANVSPIEEEMIEFELMKLHTPNIIQCLFKASFDVDLNLADRNSAGMSSDSHKVRKNSQSRSLS